MTNLGKDFSPEDIPALLDGFSYLMPNEGQIWDELLNYAIKHLERIDNVNLVYLLEGTARADRGSVKLWKEMQYSALVRAAAWNGTQLSRAIVSIAKADMTDEKEFV